MKIESEVPEHLRQIFAADITFADGRRFRPEQKELALRDANHRVMRWDHSEHAPLMLQEAGTGIGKTLEQLFVSGMFALEGDRLGVPQRTIIAIHTVALREQIAAAVPQMQAALDASYAYLNLPKPRKVVVSSLTALSQYIARDKVEQINRAIATSSGLTADERSEWTEFYTFVEQSPKDESIEMHDWFAKSNGKPLPLGLSQLTLGLDTESSGVDADRLAAVQNEQLTALNEADILIVTHTMLRLLTWKLRQFDWAAEKGKIIKNDCRGFTYLSVDEAHMLPKITRSWIEQKIVFDDLKAVLISAPIDLSKTFETFEELERYAILQLHLNGHTGSVPINTVDLIWPLVDIVERLYDQLYDTYNELNSYPLFQAKLETILVGFAPIVMLRGRGGTSSADFRDLADADAFPIVSRQHGQINIMVTAGRVARSIASLWRRNPDAPNERLYKSIVMMSGTLMDPAKAAAQKYDQKDPYRYFRFEIGAARTGGPNRDVIWYGDAILSTHVGHATQVVYPERSDKLIPTIKNTGEANPLHTKFIAMMLGLIFDQRHIERNRVLALFMSEKSMLDTYSETVRLRPDLAPHIIVQRSGMRFMGTPLHKFRDDPQAILFSMNWAGINAVDMNDRSLVDHLVLTKAPFLPADERRQLDTNLGIAIRDMFVEAHWLFRQALGRAMRDDTARFSLWIGDVRIPLPSEMTPPFARYTKQNNQFMQQLYEQFDEPISHRLFGRSGKSRTGLFAGPVRFGYLRQTGETLTLTTHNVILSPRQEDLVV